MSYNIPSEDKVEKALFNVLKDYRIVDSQNKLKELVSKKLNGKKKKYGISGARLRNIALNSNFARIEIHTREGDPKKLLNKCPVCGSPLKKIKNLTIWGGKVTIEFRCSKCNYWTGKKKRIPTRYIFHLRKKNKI